MSCHDFFRGHFIQLFTSISCSVLAIRNEKMLIFPLGDLKERYCRGGAIRFTGKRRLTTDNSVII